MDWHTARGYFCLDTNVLMRFLEEVKSLLCVLENCSNNDCIIFITKTVQRELENLRGGETEEQLATRCQAYPTPQVFPEELQTKLKASAALNWTHEMQEKETPRVKFDNHQEVPLSSESRDAMIVREVQKKALSSAGMPVLIVTADAGMVTECSCQSVVAFLIRASATHGYSLESALLEFLNNSLNPTEEYLENKWSKWKECEPTVSHLLSTVSGLLCKFLSSIEQSFSTPDGVSDAMLRTEIGTLIKKHRAALRFKLSSELLATTPLPRLGSPEILDACQAMLFRLSFNDYRAQKLLFFSQP